MFRHLLQAGIIFGFCLLLSSPEADAARKERKEKPKKEFEIIYTKFALVPKLTGGVVTGEAADELDGLNNSAIYGGGITFEWCLARRSTLGVDLEIVFGKLYGDLISDRAVVRSISYSASWLVKLSPHKRSSFFAKTEFGYSSFDAIYYDRDDLGTHPYFRVALGQSYFNNPKRFTTFEFYYKRLFSNGADIRAPFMSKIDYDVTYVGLQLGFGFSL